MRRCSGVKAYQIIKSLAAAFCEKWNISKAMMETRACQHDKLSSDAMVAIRTMDDHYW
jgi:hypothetical protein